MLAEDKLIMIISYDLEQADWEGFEGIKKLTDEALSKG